MTNTQIVSEKSEEFKFEVLDFDYNGFYGKVYKTKAPYRATFLEWTTDPGVARWTCSDGEVRLIPTFAIVKSHEYDLLPKQKRNTGVMFGSPCKS